MFRAISSLVAFESTNCLVLAWFLEVRFSFHQCLMLQRLKVVGVLRIYTQMITLSCFPIVYEEVRILDSHGLEVSALVRSQPALQKTLFIILFEIAFLLPLRLKLIILLKV